MGASDSSQAHTASYGFSDAARRACVAPQEVCVWARKLAASDTCYPKSSPGHWHSGRPAGWTP